VQIDDDAEFTAAIESWLDEHLTDRFAAIRGRGGPDSDDAWEVRRDWDRELGSGGWLGLTWPREYGGRGGTLMQEALLQMTLAERGAPARAAFHGEALLAPSVLSHGTEEQKQRLLPAMTRGELVWCQGYSEPGAGSDLAAISTRAIPVDGGWRLHGQKVWTTFAHHADWMFALVRTEAGSSRHLGISYVLVDLHQDGVDIRPIRTMDGDSSFNEVFFDGAFVSSGDVIGEVGQGWTTAMTTLGHERATSVLGHQFAFQGELEALIAEVRRRGLQDDPAVREALAVSAAGLEAITATNFRILADAAADRGFGPESSIGKLLWSTWHQEFTELAMDVLGETGVTAPEDHAARELVSAFLRARAETIYAGTTQIQLNVIGERILGLPREARPA
jgi:alkylation response protein AidB-like acyl-CoA dehydrogenase